MDLGAIKHVAGVVTQSRTKMQGKIVFVKSSQSEEGRYLVAFAPGVKWEVGVEKTQYPGGGRP